MVNSRDSSCRFRKCLILAQLIIEFYKRHQLSIVKIDYLRSYQQKTSRDGGHPPVLLRLNSCDRSHGAAQQTDIPIIFNPHFRFSSVLSNHARVASLLFYVLETSPQQNIPIISNKLQFSIFRRYSNLSGTQYTMVIISKLFYKTKYTNYFE